MHRMTSYKKLEAKVEAARVKVEKAEAKIFLGR